MKTTIIILLLFVFMATVNAGTVLHSGTDTFPSCESSTNNRLDVYSVVTEVEEIVTPTCSDCPSDNPCAKSESDGCNSCVYQVWCVHGKWYRGDTRSCTAMYCAKSIPLKGNPFEGGWK